MQGLLTALDVLATLRASGVGIIVQGEQLALDCPRGVLTDRLRQAIRAHKHALLAMMETFEERAAIIEYDGHCPRAEAERLAWSCVVEAEKKQPEAGAATPAS